MYSAYLTPLIKVKVQEDDIDMAAIHRLCIAQLKIIFSTNGNMILDQTPGDFSITV